MYCVFSDAKRNNLTTLLSACVFTSSWLYRGWSRHQMSYSVFLYFLMLVNKTIRLHIILFKTPMVLVRAGISGGESERMISTCI